MPQDTHTICEQEWQGTACRTRDHGSVNWTLQRRAAPSCVTTNEIGGADSPEVFAVVRKAISKREAKQFVCFSGFHRIFKVIGVSIPPVAKVEPSIRILVREDGIVPRD